MSLFKPQFRLVERPDGTIDAQVRTMFLWRTKFIVSKVPHSKDSYAIRGPGGSEVRVAKDRATARAIQQLTYMYAPPKRSKVLWDSRDGLTYEEHLELEGCALERDIEELERTKKLDEPVVKLNKLLTQSRVFEKSKTS